MRNLLHDKEQTSFTLVTIPEAMSVRETERYLELLREQGVPVRDLIVNRVEQEHEDCKYCRARVGASGRGSRRLQLCLASLRLHYVPLQPKEVRGIDDLKKIGKLIWEDEMKPRMTRINPDSKSVSSRGQVFVPIGSRGRS